MRTDSEGIVKDRERLRRVLRTGAAAMAAAGLIAGTAGGTAAADVSWVAIKQGADWGKMDRNGYVTVCDEESDGHAAYLFYEMEWGEAFSVTDSGGSDGVCVGTDVTGMIWGVDYIKVCERINNWPDKCSDRVYITWGD